MAKEMCGRPLVRPMPYFIGKTKQNRKTGTKEAE
jgi:hypothetical protein